MTESAQWDRFSENVSSKWCFQAIDHGCFKVVGPYFMVKSLNTTYSLTFESRSNKVRPCTVHMIYTMTNCSLPLKSGLKYHKSKKVMVIFLKSF